MIAAAVGGARGEGGDLLPAVLRDALLLRARQIAVRRGQTVITEDADSSDVYLVCEGRLQVSLCSTDGRETILREIGPDMICGELAAIDGRRRSANVIALEDGLLAHLTGTGFLAFLAEQPAAGVWIARQFARQVRHLTDRVFELSTMSVRHRLQCELLRLCIENGVEADIAEIAPVPTHAEFAARIGTHREAVTRELGALAGLGMLQQRGRRMKILSVDRLGRATRYAA